jgi:hypothetical protein
VSDSPKTAQLDTGKLEQGSGWRDACIVLGEAASRIKGVTIVTIVERLLDSK